MLDAAKLRTGDQVFFSGSCFVSRAIKVITWCKWSHVGIIINDDPNYDFPLLYESTHNNTIKGLDVNTHTQGVQVVPFYERLNQYKGSVSIRHVVNPYYENRQRLRDYRVDMIGTPFEKSKKEILASAELFKFMRGDTDLSSVFCSEHSAEALIRLGWLSNDKPSNHYTPKYLANNNDFINGVSYSEIKLIKNK